jgi:RHS repeat-associated protein
VWDTAEGLPLILSDATNNYIYGPDGLPFEQISGTPGKEAVLYIHHDQQGSTRLLTGSTGAIEGAYTYDAYGNLTGHTGSAMTPLGYDGQYTSSDTGLIYMRARTYDPSTAQFLTRDPWGAITGEPYTYTSDNPLNGDDPTGLSGLFGTGLGPNIGPDINWGEVAVPIAEGVGTVAACATPYVDIVTCPEAITAVTAVNIGVNDVNEYDAAVSGCPVGQYLESDGFELATAGLGLLTYGTLSTAEKGLEGLPGSTTGLGGAKGAVRYVNGLATGTGLAAVAAHSGEGSCGCQA